MHKCVELFFVEESVAVFTLGYFAAVDFFLTHNGKFHSALGTAVVFNRADDGENPFASLHIVAFEHFGAYVLCNDFKLFLDRVHFGKLALFVFLILCGKFRVLFLYGNGLFL